MKPDPNYTPLHHETEAQLAHEPKKTDTRTAEELLHELEVQQTELEMQNEQLRQSQVDLEESLTRYVDFYDFAPVGYLILNREGLIEEINFTGTALLGMVRSKLVGYRFDFLVAMEDRERWHRHFINVLTCDDKLTCEVAFQHDADPRFDAQLDCQRLKRIDKKPVVRVVLTNISKRKQIEYAREEALSRLQKISSMVPGVVYQYRLRPDGSACFPFASDTIREIYRVSPEEVREDASKVLAILHPDDYDGIIASIQASARDLTPWRHEYRVKFDDGTVRWLFGNALPQKEADGSVLWHGFITDITHRRQADDALRRSETKFRTLYDSTSDAVMLLDENSFLDCNKATLDIIGCATKEEFCSKSPADFSPPEQPDGTSSKILADRYIATAMEKGSHRFDWVCQRLDNGKTFFADTLLNAMELDGKPVLQVTVRDITERKQIEAALARHIHELGERIKESECLRDITKLLLNKEMGVEQVLDACVRRIPAAWLDPSHTCARIRLDKQIYESANFREAEWKLKATISITGMEPGIIEVFYFGEETADGKSPFLDEERILIQSISIQIAQSLEKRLAEAALQQNQAELKEAQRIAHMGSWRLDVTTNHVVWSEELYRMYGLNPELPVLDYPESHKLFTPESWKQLSTAISHTQETGTPYELELETVRPDGSHGWMLARGEAIWDTSGAIATLQGVAMDITERKQAEEALRESENRNRLLVENSPVCIHEIDMGGRITSMNRAGLRMMGVEDECAVRGFLYLDAVCATDRERIGELLANAYAGETSHFEFKASGPQGQIFKSCFVPIRNKEGNVEKLMGITENITERKQAEEKLQRFFDLVPELTCIASTDGYFLKINPVWQTTLGYTEQEILSTPFLDFIHPDDRGATMKEVERQLAGKATMRFTNRYRHKDGSYRWLEWTAKSDVDQKLLYASARDITARKQTDE